MLTCQPARSRPLEHLNAPRWARRRDVLALQRMVQAEPRLLYRSLAVPVSTLHFPEGTGSGQRNVLAAYVSSLQLMNYSVLKLTPAPVCMFSLSSPTSSSACLQSSSKWEDTLIAGPIWGGLTGESPTS